MSTEKKSNRAILIIAGIWQLVVYALVIGGIFGSIYEWLGVPWNTYGIRNNIIPTTIGWVLLEMPLILVAGFIGWWQRRRKPETIKG